MRDSVTPEDAATLSMPWDDGTGSSPTVTSLTLRANFSWTFAGNAAYAASQWGIVVVIAKLLSADALGRLALGLAITAPIILLTNLQLRAVQATDARREYRYGDYLAVRISTVALAFGVIALIGAGFGGETGLVIGIVGVAKGFEAVSDIGYGLLQQRERMDWIAQSMMLRGLLSLALVWIAVAATDNLVWGTVSLAAAFGIVLAAHDVRRVRRMLAAGERPSGPSPRWHAATVRRLAWLALPLGLATSLVSLTTNVPRYVIQRELGDADLGVFAAIAYLIVAGTTVVTALGQSASPRLARHYASGEAAAFRRLVRRLVAVGLGMGTTALLVSWGLGRRVLRLLYDDQYARLDVLLWITAAAAAMFVAAFLGYAMTAARYFRAQLPLFAATAGVVVAASLILIPAEGLPGAGQALLVAALVQTAGSVAVIRHAIRALGGTQGEQ